jgi:hypothetical protein
MRYAGLAVMPAGLCLVVAAILLFPAPGLRLAFILSGIAVEALGLGVALRGHLQARGERQQ